MATEAIYTKSLGGAEDLLLDASNSPTVIQTRAGKELEITKINSSTIPYSGKFGAPSMVSIKDQLDNATVRVVNSVSEMIGLLDIKVGSTVQTKGYYTPGDGGGNVYEIVAAGTGGNYGFLYEQLTESGLEAKLLGGGIMEEKTVYIPSDYATLQDAVDTLSGIKPTQGVEIVLMIESGHTVASQLFIYSYDASHFSIRSKDAEVPVSRETLTRYFVGGGYPLFGGIRNAKMPIIAALFNMDESGAPEEKEGVRCTIGSWVEVRPGAGVKNTGGGGCVISENSMAQLRGSIFTGCGKDGAPNSNAIGVGNSVVNAREADVSGCVGAHGFRATQGSICNCFMMKSHNSGRSGIRVSLTSVVFARGVDIANSGYNGLEVSESSICDARESTIIDSAHYNVQAQKSASVSCGESILTGAALNGVNAIEGSVIEANLCDVSGAGANGFEASGSSSIVANYSTANNCALNGFSASNGGKISAINSTANNCTRGANANFGGELVLNNCNFSGYTNRGVNCERSTATLVNCDCRQGDTEKTTDIVSIFGSTVRANGSTGGTNGTINTLTSNGIIFK